MPDAESYASEEYPYCYDEYGNWIDPAVTCYDDYGDLIGPDGEYIDVGESEIDWETGYYDEDGDWIDGAGAYEEEDLSWLDELGGYPTEDVVRDPLDDGYYDEYGIWVDIDDGYYDDYGAWVETGGTADPVAGTVDLYTSGSGADAVQTESAPSGDRERAATRLYDACAAQCDAVTACYGSPISECLADCTVMRDSTLNTHGFMGSEADAVLCADATETWLLCLARDVCAGVTDLCGREDEAMQLVCQGAAEGDASLGLRMVQAADAFEVACEQGMDWLVSCAGGDESVREGTDCPGERRFMTDLNYEIRTTLGLRVGVPCAEARAAWFTCLASGPCGASIDSGCSAEDEAYLQACYYSDWLWE